MQSHTIERALARSNVERTLFLHRFREELTHRADESIGARHDDTFPTAAHYLEGLLTPGPRKSIRNTAKASLNNRHPRITLIFDIRISDIRMFDGEAPCQRFGHMTVREGPHAPGQNHERDDGEE